MDQPKINLEVIENQIELPRSESQQEVLLKTRIDFDAETFDENFPEGKFDIALGGSDQYTFDVFRDEKGTIVLQEKTTSGEVRYVAAYGPGGFSGWALKDGELAHIENGSLEAAQQISTALIEAMRG